MTLGCLKLSTLNFSQRAPFGAIFNFMNPSSKQAHFDPTATFASLKGLSTIITVCGIIAIIELVIVMAMLYVENWALMHYLLPTSHLNPFFAWFIQNADVFTLFFLGGSMAFLLWFYQAYRNLYALDYETDTTPGIVLVGCIFPVANLWSPYIRMRELWQKVIDPSNWQVVKTWWATSIVAGIAYYIPQFIFPYGDIDRMIYGANSVSVISITTFFYTIATICLIGFLILTIKIVHIISTAEAVKLEALPTTKIDHSNAQNPESEAEIAATGYGIGTKIVLGTISLTLGIVVFFVIAYAIYLALS